MTTLIKNVNYYDENFNLKKGDVKFSDTIIEMGENLTADEVISGEGKLLTPGYIDIHTHGCGGFDTCDRNLQGYEKMSETYASNGVTSFLFTTMTIADQEISDTLKAVNDYLASGKGTAYSHGVYFEGPFISPKRKGAQREDAIQKPDMEVFKKYNALVNGKIKVAVVAPEMDENQNFIKEASKVTRVSMAHTDADYDTAMTAIASGASSITHLYNAVTYTVARETGVVGAVLDSDVYAELICDGIHVHPSNIRLVFKVKGEDRVLLVSDSTMAAGMPEGEYSLGGQPVYHKNGAVRLADGTLAGSATNLHTCFKNLLKFGIDEKTALKAATINPARFIGVDNVTGSIAKGKNADMILMDKNRQIVNVFVKGKQI